MIPDKYIDRTLYGATAVVVFWFTAAMPSILAVGYGYDWYIGPLALFSFILVCYISGFVLRDVLSVGEYL